MVGNYPARACAKGLSNQFCPSVSLFVSLFVSLSSKNLNIDRVKQISKTDNTTDIVKKVSTSQEAKRFYTLCFSSSFLFNVVIICHFNTVDTLEMVESGYSRT